jgi:flagellar hook-associated protein 2
MGGFNVGAATAISSQTGLGAGIDVSAYVQAALAQQSAPLTIAQQQQTQLTNQTTALNTLESQLQALQTAVEALSDPAGQFNSLGATSSDPSLLLASATAGAPQGNHTVTISNLATTSSEYSAELASSSAPTNTGAFQIQVGSGTPVTINVNSTNNTLSGIAAAINSSGAGVTANVVSDANGARLSIVSNTSGQPGDLTISSDTVGLGFTKAVTGVNAALTVDGIPITSTTNTVNGAINGVTLNLVGADPTTQVDLAIAPDVTQAEAAINSFVSAYNTVVTGLNSQFAVDPTTGQQGPLGTDSSATLVQNEVLAAAAYAPGGSSTITNLTSLGLNFNDDGTITVDQGALANALQSNYTAVQGFLQSGSSAFATSFLTTLQNLNDPTQGAIAVDLNGISSTQQSLTQQINDFQAQLAVTQQTLTAYYSQIDTTLQELPLLQAQVASQLSSI